MVFQFNRLASFCTYMRLDGSVVYLIAISSNSPAITSIYLPISIHLQAIVRLSDVSTRAYLNIELKALVY